MLKLSSQMKDAEGKVPKGKSQLTLTTVLKFADLGVGLVDLANMSGSDAYAMLRSMENDIASGSVAPGVPVLKLASQMKNVDSKVPKGNSQLSLTTVLKFADRAYADAAA